MKKIILITLSLAIIAFLSFSVNDSIESIKIGTKAPLSSSKMKDVSETNYSLEELNKENGLLVIFSCNTCPFVVGNDTGPAHMTAHLGSKGIAVFGSHTTAHKVSIERKNFKAIQVSDLSKLSADNVFEKLCNLIS